MGPVDTDDISDDMRFGNADEVIDGLFNGTTLIEDDYNVLQDLRIRYSGVAGILSEAGSNGFDSEREFGEASYTLNRSNEKFGIESFTVTHDDPEANQKLIIACENVISSITNSIADATSKALKRVTDIFNNTFVGNMSVAGQAVLLKKRLSERTETRKSPTIEITNANILAYDGAVSLDAIMRGMNALVSVNKAVWPPYLERATAFYRDWFKMYNQFLAHPVLKEGHWESKLKESDFVDPDAKGVSALTSRAYRGVVGTKEWVNDRDRRQEFKDESEKLISDLVNNLEQDLKVMGDRLDFGEAGKLGIGVHSKDMHTQSKGWIDAPSHVQITQMLDMVIEVASEINDNRNRIHQLEEAASRAKAKEDELAKRLKGEEIRPLYAVLSKIGIKFDFMGINKRISKPLVGLADDTASTCRALLNLCDRAIHNYTLLENPKED